MVVDGLMWYLQARQEARVVSGRFSPSGGM